MPSPYSSEGTRADARAIAENLGCEFMEISIAEAMSAYDDMLAGAFAGREPDVAEENVQARIRGVLLKSIQSTWISSWTRTSASNEPSRARLC